MNEENGLQEAARPTSVLPWRFKEHYRQIYAMRQDVDEKTRQLQVTLDQLVTYVRDLMR